MYACMLAYVYPKPNSTGTWSIEILDLTSTFPTFILSLVFMILRLSSSLLWAYITCLVLRSFWFTSAGPLSILSKSWKIVPVPKMTMTWSHCFLGGSQQVCACLGLGLKSVLCLVSLLALERSGRENYFTGEFCSKGVPWNNTLDASGNRREKRQCDGAFLVKYKGMNKERKYQNHRSPEHKALVYTYHLFFFLFVYLVRPFDHNHTWHKHSRISKHPSVNQSGFVVVD